MDHSRGHDSASGSGEHSQGDSNLDVLAITSAGSIVVTTGKNGKKERMAMPEHTFFVDMRDHYDGNLLKRFYNDLMIPNFPIADELDSLEYIVEMLTLAPREETEKTKAPELDFHIIMMLSLPEAVPAGEVPDFSKATILGGVVFEYYIQANVGLLTYLLVGGEYRGLRLGFILAERCRESLEANAKSRGHLAGCNAIFLETNSATKVDAENDVMPPALRHDIFYKMGLRLVDFDYVQAPLDTGKKKVNYLLLCCFITPRIPAIKMGNEESYYLPNTLLRNTVHSFWANTASAKGRKFTDDVDYKRMLDQLNRRERIALLDLPWERPFTIVDLHEHFDLELLVTFYQDLLLPCYRERPEELDSLDSWLELLSPKHKNPTSSSNELVEFHLLLALKYSDDEEENSKPMIAGGLAFEYYPGNNCGFLTYLLVPVGERGERMARALIDSALEELDTAAKRRGQLGGCNVIFMESRTGPLNANPNLEVQDIEQQHPILEAMGWKMLDFDYIQPPNAEPTKKVKTSFLLVFVTPRIPMLLQEDIKYLYLPRSTLKKFLTEMWESSCSRFPGYDFTADRDYIDMMDQIERRPRIPLLGRPWNRPWTLVDLQESSNSLMLKQFYTDMVEVSYQNKEDLEPLEIWQKRLIATNQAQISNQASPELFHVLLAVKPTIDSVTGDNNDRSAAQILGGLSFKYFEATNCGFITHALLKIPETSYRESVARALFERTTDILDQDAVARGNLAGCNAIYFETSDPNRDTGGHNRSLDISLQHQLLHKLGWRLVDFNYVAPPQRAGRRPVTHRSLAMFLTSRIPRVIMSNPEDTYHYLPRAMVLSFVHEYWRVSCSVSGFDFDQDPDFTSMTDLIARRERIPLLELPWERPWTLVDLWEDFDAQLLYKFYQNHYVLSYPDKAEREPLSKWLQLLSDDSRDDPSIEDFHVLLALQYPYKTGSKISPTILGGVQFVFYTSNSSGLLTYLSVPKIQSELMARNLIEEATVAVNENAILRGHLAGCNAIFMELPIDPSVGFHVTHDQLHKMGWRLLQFTYYQPPLSIYSTGGVQCMLLILLTINIPREDDGFVLPRDLLRSFIWQHWRDAYQRIGKSQVSKDTNFQTMMRSLQNLNRVTLSDLPWVPSSSIPVTQVSKL